MGTDYQFGRMKNSGDGWGLQLCNKENMFNSTENG